MVSRLFDDCAVGSPAHAGIDPDDVIWSAFPARFPRTRGDRPRRFWRALWTNLVPPHTRG